MGSTSTCEGKTILMLGDSLLEGFLFPTPSAPPSQFMIPLLRPANASSGCVEFINATFPGFQTHEILERFEMVAMELKKNRKEIHVACVLGGTNDLGFWKEPHEILSNLKKIYRAIRKHSPHAHIIITTIPDCRDDGETLKTRRTAVNDALREMDRADDSELARGDESGRKPKRGGSSEEGVDDMISTGQGATEGEPKGGDEGKGSATTTDHGFFRPLIASSSHKKRGRMIVMDLFSHIPFERDCELWTPRNQNMSMWHADGLHFSPNGYKRVGELYVDVITREGLLD